MGLCLKKDDELGGLEYTGPGIYNEFTKSLFEQNREEFDLKDWRMTLSPVKVGEEHRYPIEPPAFTVDQVELPEDADEDMQRSVLNKDKVCKCGFTKQLKSESQPVISRDGHKKHIRKTVMVGGLRKRPCKKCEACLREPCGKCNFCLNPKMKKPCQWRRCLFPIVPK